MNLFGLVAYASDGNANASGGAAFGIFEPLLLLVIMIVLMYFLMIRPQRKRDKEVKAMLDALTVGDKIVTIGGICGKVTKIKDNYVFIETGNLGTQDDKCLIKMERSAIKTVEKKVSE